VSFILNPYAFAVAGYTIDNSIRCNDADSPHMKRTWTGGDRRIQTFSFWVKRCLIDGTKQKIFHVVNAQECLIEFDTSNRLMVQFEGDGAGTNKIIRITTMVFRDVSAWYHIVVGCDRNQTDDTSCKVEVNGVTITDFDTKQNPSSAVDGIMGGAYIHYFWEDYTGNFPFDGYFAEIALIDGTKLAATSFGESDSNGNWVPIDISALTFGTEGSYHDFAVAPGTGDGAGTDVSGEANHYTESGLAANDQMLDSPSDDADNDVGNYCVLNPLTTNDGTGAGHALANGNLDWVDGNFGDETAVGTIGVTTGKWYWETTAGIQQYAVGIIDEDVLTSSDMTGNTMASGWASLGDGEAFGWYGHDGSRVDISSKSDYGNAPVVSDTDVIGVALDLDNRAIWSSVNDSWIDGNGTDSSATIKAEIEAGTTTSAMWTTMTAGKTFFPFFNSLGAGTDTHPVNFGQHAFTGTIPTGFKRLHTGNLAAPTIKDPSKYFQVDTFTGTGSELVRTLTDGDGGAVKPDLVWIKDRDSAVEHVLTDSARGATKEQNSNLVVADTTVAQGLKSFDTSGFTLGTDTNYNASSSANVAWCWVAASGAGSSNEDGSINTTTTSVGTTQGFSVSTYTGTGSAATIGHGLGVAPAFILCKANTTEQWAVYHHANTSAPETENLNLDDNGATGDVATTWNDTAPTSTVFSVGASTETNDSGTAHVAYCWAEVEGYSKFGGYTGNAAADGTFVWTGFRPAYILTKASGATGAWNIHDFKREGYNVDNDGLEANSTDAESTYDGIDILSNGFKLRNTGHPNTATTYIFAAFSEFPFGGDGVSQARAR